MPFKSRVPLVACALLLSSATAASAIDVRKRTEAPGLPDKVWAIAADFCAIKTWHPAIADCKQGKDGETVTRTLTLKDGGTIEEKLTGKDDLSYSYEIISSPLPVTNYKAKLWVEKDDEPDRSVILWTATFDAKDASDAEAKKVIDGIFAAGVKGIKQIAVHGAGGKDKGDDD